MEIWFNPSRELDQIVRAAATCSPPFNDSFSPQIRPAEARFGDFQANGVLPFAKRHRLSPRDLASRLVSVIEESGKLDPAYLSMEIAGPGFINFRFSPRFLHEWLQKFRSKADLQTAAGGIYRGRRIVVDYSSPNTAKEMHVGHIRSTVLGEAISRLLCFCGGEVLRDNHIGDWGTQFGILLRALKRQGYDLDRPHEDSLADLEKLYQEGNALARKDPAILEEARQELVKLQQGDLENLALWKKINTVSYRAFAYIYDLLSIQFDEVLGESFYRDKVESIYRELTETGIAKESEGALVVFHPEHERFKKQPFIIRKSDGASNYATTDLATIFYRVDHFKAEEIIYVTDARQQDHFQQLFLTVEKWFRAKGRTLPKLKHVVFGTILGEDGKAIKTRSSEPIKLKDLLQEAIERAYAIVNQKNPHLTEEECRRVARVVGLGSVRYADLMQSRTSDYIFLWEKMLSLEGNTAPYLLYAVARIHSIFRKAGLTPGEAEEGATLFETATEIALARKLVGFVDVINQTVSDLRPHFLCTYLYELAGIFSTFYKADKVIVDNPAVRARRLILCCRTLGILKTGLYLLGLETLERM